MAGIDERSESKANQLQNEAMERGAIKLDLDNKASIKKEKKPSTLAELMDDKTNGIVSDIDPESEEYFTDLIKKIKGKKED